MPELHDYKRKRDLTRSPEPPPDEGMRLGPLVFSVQKHDASRLHYDLRLEVDGALKSWAVPRGPSLNPAEKRLSVMVEDHPLAYAAFEGVIPEGEYGAGPVMVWDAGTYSPDEDARLYFDDRDGAERQVRSALAGGKLSVVLRGKRLKGSWALVRLRRRPDQWLLIKHDDRFASPDREAPAGDRSALSGLTLDEIRAGLSHAGGRYPLSPAYAGGARPASFPRDARPMLAMLADVPFSHPEWSFEPKLDGIRALALLSHGRARLLSRRGNEITLQYPSLVQEVAEQPADGLVLDGEIVALDESGHPSFERLQQRMNLTREPDIRHAEVEVPVIYYVFDLLHLDGFDLRLARLEDRQSLLDAVVAPSSALALLARFREEGNIAFQAAVAQGFEGVVAKRLDSVYEPGRRSRNWLKVKAVLSDDFVIGGFNPGKGVRAESFASLLVGQYDTRKQLVYAGNIGTGFGDRLLRELRTRLDSRRAPDSPFGESPRREAGTVWVRPELVAEVKFAERTSQGRLRAPVFMRLRPDKSPAEAVMTPGAPTPASADSEPRLATQAGAIADALRESTGDKTTIEVEGYGLSLNNLDKEMWPALNGNAAVTKRDLLVYLAEAAPYLLRHMRDRPLTFVRYPEGITGQHFYQKHWGNHLPPFVDSVLIPTEEGEQLFLVCDNLATLLWLGQIADLELHTWLSRTTPPSRRETGLDPRASSRNTILDFPDFMVFDLDPYLYSGREAEGEEPELNRAAFEKTCEIALHLRDVLAGVSLPSFAKTSGCTGLHVFVPVHRQLDFDAIRAASRSVAVFVVRQHPRDTTIEWAVEKRRGKVFIDYNQNSFGKTLAVACSPRRAPEATVSMPLSWDELGKVYPTDFTMRSAPERMKRAGDPWERILEAKADLTVLLREAPQ